MKNVFKHHLFWKIGFLVSTLLPFIPGNSQEDFEYDLSLPSSRIQTPAPSWDTESPAKGAYPQNPSIIFSLDTPSQVEMGPSLYLLESLNNQLELPEIPAAAPQPAQAIPRPSPAVEAARPTPAPVPIPVTAPTTAQVAAPAVEPQTAPAAETPPTETPGTPLKLHPSKTILINFNNVGIIEYIRFISRISNKNFIFDEGDLQFNVTIVSEEPTSIENIMTALLQELRIHDLILIEQGNNLIIHKNPKVNSISKVVDNTLDEGTERNSELVTQVFRLNTLDPEKAATLLRPLISDRALVEFVRETNHIIVTDLVSNVNQIAKLLKSLDAPNSGLVIGQFVSHSAEVDTLVPLIQRIMQPISLDQPLIFVPYETSNSIFIVSTPFLVERSISILQHLDQERGKTRIIDLRDLKFQEGQAGAGAGGIPGGVTPPFGVKPRAPQPPPPPPGITKAEFEAGLQKIESAGLGIVPLFVPVEIPVQTPISAEEQELLNRARLSLPPPPDRVGITEFERRLPPIQTQRFEREVESNPDFVAKQVKETKFFIYKMQYRRGDVMMNAIQKVAVALQCAGRGNEELIAAINCIQWLQDAKSLVLSGTPEIIDKMRDLVEQLDIPLRQVFIEMLILDTTVTDSLNYSVNYANRFGGANQAGSQGFFSGASPLQGAMDTAGVTGLGGNFPNTEPPNPFNNALIPNPNNLAKQEGFSLGVIGQNITHKGLGLRFNSIGALVQALHRRDEDKIVMSPKLITEDGVPAQIFVGINTPYKTQSIANDRGSTITNNFEYRDVGTSLQVTPYLNNSDIITLEIIQESSSIGTQASAGQNVNTSGGPTTKKNTTRTTVNVPDGYFCVISGMLQDEKKHIRTQVPCLGSIPILGAAFTDKHNIDQKTNLMLFIRPVIVDTDEEIQNLTRHEQDVWSYQNELPKMWIQETEQALDLFNVRQTLKTDDEDDKDLECCGIKH